MDSKYFIAELVAMKANIDRLIREAEQARREEAGQSPERRSEHKPAPMPEGIRDPLAKSQTDLVTPKQLGMIKALAREAGLDPDEECQTKFRCKTVDLSKRAASSFIEHLQRCKQEFEQPRRAS